MKLQDHFFSSLTILWYVAVWTIIKSIPLAKIIEKILSIESDYPTYLQQRFHRTRKESGSLTNEKEVTKWEKEEKFLKKAKSIINRLRGDKQKSQRTLSQPLETEK